MTGDPNRTPSSFWKCAGIVSEITLILARYTYKFI